MCLLNSIVMSTLASARARSVKCFAPALLACVSAVSVSPSVACAAEDLSVRAFHDRFFAAWNAGDLEGLVDALSEDTVYHPMNAATIRGREKLAEVYGQFLGDYHVQMIVSAELLEADGDRGTMMGLYRSTMTPKNGDPPISRGGRYYMDLRRGPDGRWQITRELTQPTADPVPGGPVAGQ